MVVPLAMDLKLVEIAWVIQIVDGVKIHAVAKTNTLEIRLHQNLASVAKDGFIMMDGHASNAQMFPWPGRQGR